MTDPLLIEKRRKLKRKGFTLGKIIKAVSLPKTTAYDHIADQNIKKLEKFWSQVTKISLSQFYKARIDPRTIGKPSKKPNYKGVCRIDYFSADLFIELMQIPKIIHKGP